jgi:hypothetical protein
MARGKSRLAVGVICAFAAALVAAPAPASAAVDEYTLGLDLGGNESGGGEEETTTAPTAPIYPTAPTYESFESTTTTVTKKRKPEELAPALAASSANAQLGPAKAPPLEVGDNGRAVPPVAVVLALLAAAACLLAIWRLRFLRELPAAPRRRAPRSVRELPAAPRRRAPRSAI